MLADLESQGGLSACALSNLRACLQAHEQLAAEGRVAEADLLLKCG